MSQKNNLWASLVIIFGVIFLAGCGVKNISEQTKNSGKTGKNIETQGKNLTQEKFPAPTGSISDITNSIDSEVQEEEALASMEGNDAEDAVSDKVEADNFGATYDENEF